jgi:methionyl-tRNA formyltransferase
MDVVFLGVNNYGWKIYDWLCERTDASVKALITTTSQLELVDQIQPDILIAAGFGEIVSPQILAIPEQGSINVHPGYLPHARGYNPNVWSIVEDLPAGVSIHYMEEEVDAGDVIARTKLDVSFEDTGKSLYDRLETAAVDLFKETWPAIVSGNISGISQDESKARSHLKQDFVDLCEIDPREEYQAKELVDILRALTYPPFDNAFMEIEGRKYYLEVDIQAESSGEANDGFTSEY